LVLVEVLDDRADVDADARGLELGAPFLELLRVVLLVLLPERVDQLRHLRVELLEVRLDAELLLLDPLLVARVLLCEQDRAEDEREGRREHWTHNTSGQNPESE